MSEEFQELYRLAREGQHALVVQAMLADNGRMRRQYADDFNHAWYVAADALYHMGDLTRALTGFRRALAHDADDTWAMMGMANCLSDMGRHRAAAKVLQRAVYLAPDSAELRYNLGNALFDLGRYAESMAEYAHVTRDAKVGAMARKNVLLARDCLAEGRKATRHREQGDG